MVRVRSYLENEVIEFGSGVVLSPGYVLTAAHILQGDRHVVILNGKEKNVIIKASNHVAALLTVNPEALLSETEQRESKEVLPSKPETQLEGEKLADQIWLTEEELLTESTKWSAEGFITDKQVFHTLSGTGLISVECREYQEDLKGMRKIIRDFLVRR